MGETRPPTVSPFSDVRRHRSSPTAMPSKTVPTARDDPADASVSAQLLALTTAMVEQQKQQAAILVQLQQQQAVTMAMEARFAAMPPPAISTAQASTRTPAAPGATIVSQPPDACAAVSVTPAPSTENSAANTNGELTEADVRATESSLSSSSSVESSAFEPSVGQGKEEWLVEGALAQIRGLNKRQDLNGRQVIVLRWEEKTGRWSVQIKGGTDCVNVLPSNLEQIEQTSGAVLPSADEEARVDEVSTSGLAPSTGNPTVAPTAVAAAGTEAAAPPATATAAASPKASPKAAAAKTSATSEDRVARLEYLTLLLRQV